MSGWAQQRLRLLSEVIARIEAHFAAAMVFAILVILLANVVSRAFGKPLIWTDELAVYLMVMGAFSGASVGLAHRQHITVTLLSDMVSLQTRRWLSRAVDIVLLAIFLVFGWTLWAWFDPLGVLAAENMKEYGRSSFNFLYDAPTTTLGIRKVWFWLIMPCFCITGVIHILSRFGDMPKENTP